VPREITDAAHVDDVERLRAAIRARMAQRGVNEADLAELAVGDRSKRDRFYKALNGSDDRGITPETLKLIADALATTPLNLKRQAGVLSSEERDHLRRQPSTRDVIEADVLLSPVDRDTLLRLYDRFTGGQG